MNALEFTLALKSAARVAGRAVADPVFGVLSVAADVVTMPRNHRHAPFPVECGRVYASVSLSARPPWYAFVGGQCSRGWVDGRTLGEADRCGAFRAASAA